MWVHREDVSLDLILKSREYDGHCLYAVSQEEQDKADEEDEREAMQNLVQTWLESFS